MKKDPDSNPALLAHREVTRREVLKWCAALGGASLLPMGLPPGLARAASQPPYGAGEQCFYSGCVVNCGSQCTLRAFVKDGRVTRVETDNSEDGPHNRAIRACLRGRSMRKYTYSPDRIKYPMRRVAGAKRGEGKFERISWDEALDTVAREWVRVLNTYGPESIHRMYGSGTTSSGMTRRNEFFRLANLLGGHLDEYGTYSTAQIAAAIPYLYGSNEGNTINDMANSKLIVMFGCNILETRQSGGGLSYELFEARQKGNARIIMVDPRYSDSMAKLGDEWVPIRPGSDGALIAAMAHVLMSEGLVDRQFVDTHCLGFDEEHMPEGVPAGNSYSAYIMGEGPDKTPKTPQWAETITGYPAEKIIRLAREVGSTKPCCIIQGWGPQRHANGDTISRSIAMLAILTGNVGLAGGGSGSAESVSQINFPRMPEGTNPVKTRISFYTWINAIDDYTQVTAAKMGLRNKEKLDHGIKFLWNSSGNALINQHSDINGTRRILEDESKCECIVVVENRMTSSARFADILLPSVTPLEQDDIIQQGYQVDQGSLLIARKAIEPLFETRSQYDICAALSEKIGKLLGQPDLAAKYTEGRSQLDWVQHLYAYEGMRKHPFQLIGHHYKGRAHSSYANIPWLEQVAPQQLWMNEADAARRGIRHDDTVKVFNDRGAVVVRVKVTPRIMPGVLSLPQGAWYAPDKNGVDLGGCINTLTKTHMTPLAKGNPQHTNLVDVVKT